MVDIPTEVGRELARAWRKCRYIARTPLKAGWFAAGLVLLALYWVLTPRGSVGNISQFLDFLTLLVLVGTAAVLYWTRSAIRESSDKDFLAGFIQRYESNEMYEVMTAISDFGRNNKNDLHNFRKLLTTPDPQIGNEEEVIASRIVHNMDQYANSGRRRVLNLYKHPWRLCQEGYLGEETLKLIAETNAVRLLYPTIMPASAAVHFVDVCKLNREQFLRDRGRFFWIKDLRTWRHQNMPPAFHDEPA